MCPYTPAWLDWSPADVDTASPSAPTGSSVICIYWFIFPTWSMGHWFFPLVDEVLWYWSTGFRAVLVCPVIFNLFKECFQVSYGLSSAGDRERNKWDKKKNEEWCVLMNKRCLPWGARKRIKTRACAQGWWVQRKRWKTGKEGFMSWSKWHQHCFPAQKLLQ